MADSSAPEPAALAEWTDAALARCVLGGAQGAAAAEAELCARLAPRVRSYGRRHLRSDDLAAELVQRVLVLLLEKLRAGAVREPERVVSFVLGTARMTALEMRRRREREQPVEDLGDVLVAPAASDPAPVAPDQLARCFDALSDRERDTLVGTYFGELSSDHLGQALGVSASNVRQLRRRAVLRLRQCLGLELEACA